MVAALWWWLNYHMNYHINSPERHLQKGMISSDGGGKNEGINARYVPEVSPFLAPRGALTLACPKEVIIILKKKR